MIYKHCHIHFGYVFPLNERHTVSLSTIEVEFVAASSRACQEVWMRRVLEKFDHFQEKCITMLRDNKFDIKLSKRH